MTTALAALRSAAADNESGPLRVKAAAPAAAQGARGSQAAQRPATPAADTGARPFLHLMHGLATQDGPPPDDAAAEDPADRDSKTAEGSAATGTSPPADAAPGDSSLPGMAMPLLPLSLDASMQLQLAAHAAPGAFAALAAGGAAPNAAADAAKVALRPAATLTISGAAVPGAGRDSAPDGAARPANQAAAGQDLRLPAPTDNGATSDSRAASAANPAGPTGATGAAAGAGPRNAGAAPAADAAAPAASERPPIGNSTTPPVAGGLPSQADTLPEFTLKLPAAAPAQWRQPLAEALGDRLQMQVGRNVEQAVIRLDPPMLGRIDISIRHEAGALQVHISASNADVLRHLHSTGEGLRQDMEQRQGGSVSVQVSDSNNPRGGDPRQRPPQADAEDDPPGKALAEAERGHQVTFASSSRTEPGSP
jgi:flagellar hook-length control protein FliK